MKKIPVLVITVAALSLSTSAEVDVAIPQEEVQPASSPCELKGLTNRRQETSQWCWVASAQLVIEYLSQSKMNQCDMVNKVFNQKLREREQNSPDLQLSCCKVGNEYSSSRDRNVLESRSVCIQGGLPEWVFDNPNYNYRYSRISYDYSSETPQGLPWDELILQICDNRPFIFSNMYKTPGGYGGGHTAGVGGYRELDDGTRWVEVYDPGQDGFSVWPYDQYLGPTRDYAHDLDYINILPPKQ